MRNVYTRLSVISVLMLGGVTAQALPFSSFDPRSMAMGGTGVAVDDPSTAPFYNPAMLSAADHSKKFSIEFISLGASLIDPGNIHTIGPSLVDNSTALTAAVTPLINSATTLTTDTTALTTNITGLSGLTISSAADLSTVSAKLGTVNTNLTTVSGDMTTVSSNATIVANNINTINQQLLSINNQPVQAAYGAASVIGIPGKEWGMAVYANAWGAMGATLEYKDSATVSTITGAVTTTAGALSSSSTAINASSTSLTTAINDVNAANTACTASSTSPTCIADLSTALTALQAAQSALTTASGTLATNATTVSNQSNVVNGNTSLQSLLHIRGVAVEEFGLSISHALVTNDKSWSWGITPKLMQMRMYDVLVAASTNLNSVSSNDYLANYSTLNFDAGLSKTFLNGWRSGIVVKNVIPQTFDFKNAPTPGATPVADGATLNLKPQVRGGFSYENPWFALAFDADITRNDPAGLENPSQYMSLGGELNTSDWTQIRAGYRADMINTALNVASLGIGLSPRLPYFKPHFDLAIIASPDIFASGWNGATQVGISLKMGLNF